MSAGCKWRVLEILFTFYLTVTQVHHNAKTEHIYTICDQQTSHCMSAPKLVNELKPDKAVQTVIMDGEGPIQSWLRNGPRLTLYTSLVLMATKVGEDNMSIEITHLTPFYSFICRTCGQLIERYKTLTTRFRWRHED